MTRSSPHRLSALAVACLLVGALGCPPAAPPSDAAIDDTLDGALDAALDGATERDAPGCGSSCGSTQERCCPAEGGALRCIDVAFDVANCGACGLDCRSTQRGDRCVAMQCSCGPDSPGCTGEDTSRCCPPAPDGRAERCANVGRDFADCGACGSVCDLLRANRCEGGRCVCGVDGSRCAGTSTDRCCTDRFGVAACVDTTSDPDHCGGCDLRCGATERCDEGACVDRRDPTP